MALSVSLSQACGSTALSLQVFISDAMMASFVRLHQGPRRARFDVQCNWAYGAINSAFRRCHRRGRLRFRHDGRQIRHSQLAVLRQPPPCRQIIGPQIMPPRHFIDGDTWHQRFSYDIALVRI